MKCKEIPAKKNNTAQDFYFVYHNNSNWQKYLLKTKLFQSLRELGTERYICMHVTQSFIAKMVMLTL